MNVEGGRESWNNREDLAMAQALRHTRLPLCFTDPTLPDNPIIYANSAFCELTGYPLDEILGRNCRFLQGDATTTDSIDNIRRIIEKQEVATVEILNYRKDGTPFVNALQIGPIMDDDGKIAFYFGSQLDITAEHERQKTARKLANDELLHRLRNIVNVMSVTVKMTARSERDPVDMGHKINARLHALSDAHFSTFGESMNNSIEVSTLASSILTAYAPLGQAQFELLGPNFLLPGGLTSPVTLLMHELATNAVKHGALSVETGHVAFHWSLSETANDRTLICHWRETDGPEVKVPERASGSQIVQALVAAAGGTLSFDWRPEGLVVEASLPVGN
ncbi:PAS domain-containing protein [Sulfitobacter sabulilitoris]|nr:PAS domain-containing protein [Sulfitobacter sabulilitoris]